jgi:hypothetical protein
MAGIKILGSPPARKDGEKEKQRGREGKTDHTPNIGKRRGFPETNRT